MTRPTKRSTAGALRCSIEEPSAKERLARMLNDLVRDRNLSQSQASRVLAMPQPKVSAIHNYKLRGISMQRLMRALTAFGHHVEIVVSPLVPTAHSRIAAKAQLRRRSSAQTTPTADVNPAAAGPRQ